MQSLDLIMKIKLSVHCIKLFLFGSLIFTISHSGYSQVSEIRLSGSYNNTPIVEVIIDLEEKYGIKFFFKEDWLQGIFITTEFQDETVNETFSKIFFSIPLSYELFGKRTIVIVNENLPQRILPNFTISGYIKDADSGKAIENANIYFPDLERGVVTDPEGYYSIEVPAGRYTMVIRSLNISEKVLIENIFENRTLNIEIFKEAPLQLEGVTISGEAIDDNITNIQPGKITIAIESIRKLPTFMGEVDITRIIVALPGVTTVGDGATGFNVRGGNIDQNLILLDRIPIFNSSHLLGFFSIFNPDIVGDFSLYKGGIPAKYGGRLSSVLDVSQKTPNKQDLKFEGGVGPIISKLSTEIPIIKGVSGIIIGGRAAYPTWVIHKVEDKDLKNSSAKYFDLNMKYHHIIGNKDVVSFSGYLSKDEFNSASDTTFQYSTRGISLIWNHTFNPNLILDVSGVMTRYKAELIDNTVSREFQFEDGIKVSSLSGSLIFNHSESASLDLGFNVNYNELSQGDLTPIKSSILGHLDLGEEKSLESAFFVNEEIKVSTNFFLSAGIRYSIFTNIGPVSEFQFDANQPRSELSIVDTLVFNKGEFIRNFTGIEPRFSINYKLNESTSFKANYNRTRQYIHLVSSTTASLPTDLWKASDNNISPAINDQISIGVFRNFQSNNYETSAEFFHKSIKNIVEVRIGADVLLNQALPVDILNSKGRSYGFELFLKKRRGTINGWVSYTFSKSERKITSPFEQDQLNDGKYFPSNFDSPHNLNIVSNIKLSRLWSFSSSFIFNSGRPVTIPESSFVIGGVRVFSTKERNNFRIPDTHRLDLSFTLEGTNKKNKKWISSYTFSVFNIYGRKNPFSVFLKAQNNTRPRVFKLSVLGSAFPSVTYGFKLVK